jgi:hypothetical protein
MGESGLATAARAIVKGNRIKAELVLDVARAHELPDSWLPMDAGEGSTTAFDSARLPDVGCSDGVGIEVERPPAYRCAQPAPSQAIS